MYNFKLLLVALAALLAVETPQVFAVPFDYCHGQTYSTLLVLSQYSSATSYCTKNYPPQTSTSTITAAATTITTTATIQTAATVTATVTAAASVIAPATTISGPVTAGPATTAAGPATMGPATMAMVTTAPSIDTSVKEKRTNEVRQARLAELWFRLELENEPHMLQGLCSCIDVTPTVRVTKTPAATVTATATSTTTKTVITTVPPLPKCTL